MTAGHVTAMLISDWSTWQVAAGARQLHQRAGREEDQVCQLQRQQAHQVGHPDIASGQYWLNENKGTEAPLTLSI